MVATGFAQDHHFKPYKSSCWWSISLLLSTSILTHWIPCNLIYFLQSSSHHFHWGHCICCYYLSDFNALGDSDQNAHQVFTTTTAHVHVHHTQALRQVGSITPFQGLSHYMHVVFQEHGFSLAMYILDEKASISSFFVILTGSFKL